MLLSIKEASDFLYFDDENLTIKDQYGNITIKLLTYFTFIINTFL